MLADQRARRRLPVLVQLRGATCSAPAAGTSNTNNVASPASASVRRGRRASPCMLRTGSSTQRLDSHASSTVSSSTTAWKTPSGRCTTYGINTNNGQCHRYSEYDRSPVFWTGRHASSRVGAPRTAGAPARITASVPRIGSSAATPGKIVSGP